MLIVGGGYIALEFANIFSGLGSEMRIVHRGDRCCAASTTTCARTCTSSRSARGIRLTMNATLTKIEKAGAARRATLSTGEKVDDRRGAVRHRPAIRTPPASASNAPA